MTSPETGILYSQVECDPTVPKGALLAYVTDFFGKTIAKVRSPLEGAGALHRGHPAHRQGTAGGLYRSAAPVAPALQRARHCVM